MPLPQFKLACYALIHNHHGQILLLQRPAEKYNFPNKWELPGGKLDPGETIEQTVCREAREECDLAITPLSFAGAVEFMFNELHIIMLIIHATSTSTDVKISQEHQAFRWVTPQEAIKMDLTDQLAAFFRTHQPLINDPAPKKS